MALSKKPVTGMKDILPDEMKIRDYVISVINDTYRSYGFTKIETPVVEHIENLTNKQGGDNEKLIFRILKRGEKLDLASAKEEADLTDSGLRYDLTVPLVRYYSAHANDLPVPFKALQMGNVFRADRPQRGRYRQFMQCDIDILGESTNLAEIELILATTTTIGKLGFKGFEIRINDRRLLKAMAAFAGFGEEDYDSVFITLDKMDKIGLDGVRAELSENGYESGVIDRYLSLFEGNTSCPGGDGADGAGEASDKSAVSGTSAVEKILALSSALGESLDPSVKENLTGIIEAVEAAKDADFRMVFDPTLVRGMSYYTGTIFEISLPEFGGSCGGGGRYDEMVGKFTGNSVPACGFSIGFERIILLLTESGFKLPGESDKCAFLIEKGMPKERLSAVLSEARQLRETGTQVLTVYMNKNKKFQKEQLAKEGYVDIKEYYVNPLN
ncbi:MAG: histidine--tRNA ligase [Lachnospiraceae bacterium]|nr:histidine--tRNA ligase [Lachnospiraceae bacterium]